MEKNELVELGQVLERLGQRIRDNPLEILELGKDISGIDIVSHRGLTDAARQAEMNALCEKYSLSMTEMKVLIRSLAVLH